MSEYVSPLLRTAWGQTGDYAQKVIDLGWGNNNIGCQCLALAQILYFHRMQPHRSEEYYYKCRAKNKTPQKIGLSFDEDYEHSFPNFPSDFVGATASQMAPVQSYLFDVARAYRKNFYGGYVHSGRESVEILMTHFDVTAKYYYYYVDGSLDVNHDHENLDGDTSLTIRDAKLLIKREISAKRPLWMYINRAAVGPKVWSSIWSKGWTTAKFYTVIDPTTSIETTYLFLLKEEPEDNYDQNVEIREVNNGSVGNVVWSTHWSEGWTTASFFVANGTTYLFVLKKTAQDEDEDNVVIYEMDGASVGDIVWSKHWSDGWTTAEFYTTNVAGDETMYLFLLKETAQHEEEKNAVIRKMNGASVGDETWSEHWDDGWTTAKFYTIGTTTYLFRLKETAHDEEDDNVIINMISKGNVSTEEYSAHWSNGWTTSNFYKFTDPSTGEEKTYVFLLKERPEDDNERNVAVYEMSDGKRGRQVETRHWSPGWTTADIYVISGKTFLFLLKENEFDLQGNNVTTQEMKENCDAHAVVVDGFKEDDDGTFSVCLKYGAGSSYNGDLSNPKWVELEKDIHDLDGEQRRFISIEPR